MKASHCLTEMADALAVSKSGFFAHQRKRERPRAQQDNELSQAIEPIFVTSRKTYGSPRIMHALRRSGGAVAKIASPGSCAHAACAPGKNVALERKQREAITNCRGAKLAGQDPQTGSSRPGLASRYYLHPDPRGWLYLSGILDHCSRRCIGWHAQESLASSLVSRAWEKACLNQPLAPGCSIIPIAAFSTQHPISNASALSWRDRFHEPQSQSIRQRDHGKLFCHSQNRMLSKSNSKKSP